MFARDQTLPPASGSRHTGGPEDGKRPCSSRRFPASCGATKSQGTHPIDRSVPHCRPGCFFVCFTAPGTTDWPLPSQLPPLFMACTGDDRLTPASPPTVYPDDNDDCSPSPGMDFGGLGCRQRRSGSPSTPRSEAPGTMSRPTSSGGTGPQGVFFPSANPIFPRPWRQVFPDRQPTATKHNAIPYTFNLTNFYPVINVINLPRVPR